MAGLTLEAEFAKRHTGGFSVRAALEAPASGFSVTVLFGPSGCGKTTVLRCLAGLDRPDSGSIRFAGETWFDGRIGSSVSPQRRGLGFLTQDYALFPHLSVAQNIGYGLRGVPAPERRRRVVEVSERFGLMSLEGRRPGQLSGGEQQRVALARTLIRRPRLVLLDEPLSALDAPLRERLRGELRRWLAEFGSPVIVVTHDRTEAIALADQVVVMEGGIVRQAGPVPEVFSRPRDLAVARVVGVETVEPGRVISVESGLARVVVGSAELLAVAPEHVGLEVHVCIRAEDVALQKTPTGPGSVRNRLQGRVRSIVPEGPLVRVVLDCGFLLTALITRLGRDDLDLRVDDEATALVKAPAVHLVPRDSRSVGPGPIIP